jgi:secondary thiamine-phosphate synthase enzyme
MSVYREKLSLRTSGNRDMTDITAEVNAIIRRSGIREGICHVFNIGSTGVIGTIEFEPGLERDFPEMMHRLIPPSRAYGHEDMWHDGNGHSHLQASLAGPELTLPVEEGLLLTGTWQQVFHYEADIKPRSRQVAVTVIGE